ncbi:MAG: ankyrin repeat domain-containing protein [Mariniblastus sp.]
MTTAAKEEFLTYFRQANLQKAARILRDNPDLLKHEGYLAHPLLEAFLENNNGRCHKRAHVQIANLLTADRVCELRDAVLADDQSLVQSILETESELVAAEFVVDHGVGRCIHYGKSNAMAEVLLKAGADVNALTSLGESPLSLQLKFGTLETVKFLLEKGADPNIGGLMHLPSESMEPRIELLLSHGWKLDETQMLHDASHGFGKRVLIWLKHGADPNVRDADGKSALHLLAENSQGQKIIRTLVEAGADVQAVDNAGNTPLELAQLASQSPAIIKALERFEPPESADSEIELGAFLGKETGGTED